MPQVVHLKITNLAQFEIQMLTCTCLCLYIQTNEKMVCMIAYLHISYHRTCLKLISALTLATGTRRKFSSFAEIADTLLFVCLFPRSLQPAVSLRLAWYALRQNKFISSLGQPSGAKMPADFKFKRRLTKGKKLNPLSCTARTYQTRWYRAMRAGRARGTRRFARVPSGATWHSQVARNKQCLVDQVGMQMARLSATKTPKLS